MHTREQLLKMSVGLRSGLVSVCFFRLSILCVFLVLFLCCLLLLSGFVSSVLHQEIGWVVVCHVMCIRNVKMSSFLWHVALLTVSTYAAVFHIT